jgi:hypothetical protein
MMDLDGWHADESRYNREALGKPEKSAEGQKPAELLPGMLFRLRAGMPLKHMTWGQFRMFYAKRHDFLTSVSLQNGKLSIRWPLLICDRPSSHAGPKETSCTSKTPSPSPFR